MSSHNYIFILLLVIFIVLPIQVPEYVASLFDNLIGKVFILGASIILLLKHPILGALFIFASYEFLRRAGIIITNTYIPNEKNKYKYIQNLNPTPKLTLEEETVRKMVYKKPVEVSFKPVLDDLHNATTL